MAPFLSHWLFSLYLSLTPHHASTFATCSGVSPADRLPISATSGVVLCNASYASQASAAYREPIWSAEHLTEESVTQAEALHGRAQFHPDYRLRVGDRSELDDYRGSGWTRGHLAPSGDAPDWNARTQTFVLSNVVPQDGVLNSGRWDHIEHSVRDLAVNDGEVYVVTGPGFRSDLGAIGIDHVRIPSSLWKAVYAPADRAVAVVVCKNEADAACHQVPYAALVSATGIDPFPGISNFEKSKRLSIPGWPE